MSGFVFPPGAPTCLQGIIPAYVYQQYSDDANIQAFNSSYNAYAQVYLNWFNTIELPIYTGLSGSLLDWVANGVYGIYRPSLPYGIVQAVGPLATWEPGTYLLASYTTTGQVQDFTTTDDIFKRIITWYFFKGDGQNFSVTWLKRRIMRFLIGINGVAPNIDNTYPISVAFGVSNSVSIQITLTTDYPITLATAQVFQAAVASGAVSLPFQFTFSVSIVNQLSSTGLFDAGGILQVTDASGWPTVGTGAAGTVWDAGGAVYVIPGHTPDPTAPPVFYNQITAAQLLALGGGNLPATDPRNLLQLWNNTGIVCVSLG